MLFCVCCFAPKSFRKERTATPKVSPSSLSSLFWVPILSAAGAPFSSPVLELVPRVGFNSCCSPAFGAPVTVVTRLHRRPLGRLASVALRRMIPLGGCGVAQRLMRSLFIVTPKPPAQTLAALTSAGLVMLATLTPHEDPDCFTVNSILRTWRSSPSSS